MENTSVETGNMENNIPVNPDNYSILIKLIIWFIIWWIISALIFMMFIFLWTTLNQAIKNSANHIAFSPLVWLVFLWIWLIAAIFWNLILALIFNVARPEDYYDIKIMSSSILSVNLLLILPFLFLYFFTWTILQDIKLLFIVFWFHIFFATFISVTAIDIIKNPNYGLLYIIWDSMWFILSLLVFFIIFSFSSSMWWEVEKNILFFPSILAFSLIPFIGTIAEKLYYKLYELWNDFLYVPSISEVMVDEEEIDEVNVEINN